MAIAVPESRQTFLLGHRSPNFWTSQSCSLSSNCFFSSASIHLLIIRWTQPSPLSQAQAWVRNHILATYGVCSTNISLDSSRVFLKYAKIQQEKERRCWQGETPPEASKRRRDIFKQKAWNFRPIFSCLSLSDSNNIKPSIEVRLINEPGNHQDCALNFLQYYEGKRRLSLLHMRWVLPTHTMRAF